MAGIDERVRGFVDVWERRKSGELSALDMRVICQSCGVQVMQGEPVAFTVRGLLCKECANGTANFKQS